MSETLRIVPQDVRVKQIFEESGALMFGHFEYTKGEHGEWYFNKNKLNFNPNWMGEISLFLARDFQARSIDTVAGTALGAITLSDRVATHLTRLDGRIIPGIFAEKDPVTGKLEFKRTFAEAIKRKRVLIIEDVLNTGGSAKDMVDAILKTGGIPIAISALVNRGGVKPEDIGGVPIKSLLDVNMERWSPQDCRLCKDGIPLNQIVGHAAK